MKNENMFNTPHRLNGTNMVGQTPGTAQKDSTGQFTCTGDKITLLNEYGVNVVESLVVRCAIQKDIDADSEATLKFKHKFLIAENVADTILSSQHTNTLDNIDDHAHNDIKHRTQLLTAEISNICDTYATENKENWASLDKDVIISLVEKDIDNFLRESTEKRQKIADLAETFDRIFIKEYDWPPLVIENQKPDIYRELIKAINHLSIDVSRNQVDPSLQDKDTVTKAIKSMNHRSDEYRKLACEFVMHRDNLNTCVNEFFSEIVQITNDTSDTTVAETLLSIKRAIKDIADQICYHKIIGQDSNSDRMLFDQLDVIALLIFEKVNIPLSDNIFYNIIGSFLLSDSAQEKSKSQNDVFKDKQQRLVKGFTKLAKAGCEYTKAQIAMISIYNHTQARSELQTSMNYIDAHISELPDTQKGETAHNSDSLTFDIAINTSTSTSALDGQFDSFIETIQKCNMKLNGNFVPEHKIGDYQSLKDKKIFPDGTHSESYIAYTLWDFYMIKNCNNCLNYISSIHALYSKLSTLSKLVNSFQKYNPHNNLQTVMQACVSVLQVSIYMGNTDTTLSSGLGRIKNEIFTATLDYAMLTKDKSSLDTCISDKKDIYNCIVDLEKHVSKHDDIAHKLKQDKIEKVKKFANYIRTNVNTKNISSDDKNRIRDEQLAKLARFRRTKAVEPSTTIDNQSNQTPIKAR